MDLEQRSAQSRVFCFLRAAELHFRQRDAKFLRDKADRFGEGDVFDLLDEGEDVTRDAASEAVKELTGGVHGEGWRFFVVERAESGKILRTRLLELYIVAHDADDVGLLLDGFLEIDVGHGWVRVKFYCGAEVRRREMAGPWWSAGKAVDN